MGKAFCPPVCRRRRCLHARAVFSFVLLSMSAMSTTTTKMTSERTNGRTDGWTDDVLGPMRRERRTRIQLGKHRTTLMTTLQFQIRRFNAIRCTAVPATDTDLITPSREHTKILLRFLNCRSNTITAANPYISLQLSVHIYEGRSINVLQNGTIPSVLKTVKIRNIRFVGL